MANPLSHREGLDSKQVDILDESATQLYAMLARAAQNGIFPELVTEIGNQLQSQTWEEVMKG